MKKEVIYMMYPGDIHKYDEVAILNKNYREAKTFIEEADTEYGLARDHALRLQEFDLFTEDGEQGLMESAKNTITRLGQFVMSIIRRLRDFISQQIQNWKTRAWNRKSDEEKFREIEREYPKEVGDLRVAVDRGMLKFSTYKDMKDFYENIDQLMIDIRKHNIDPKSIRGRWESIKTKMENNRSNIETFVKVLGLVVSAGGLYVTWKKWKKSDQDGQERRDIDFTNDNLKKQEASLRATMDALKHIKHSGDGSKNVESATVVSNIITEMESMVGKDVVARIGFSDYVRRSIMEQAGTLKDKIKAGSTAAYRQLETIQDVMHGVPAEATFRRNIKP